MGVMYDDQFDIMKHEENKFRNSLNVMMKKKKTFSKAKLVILFLL